MWNYKTKTMKHCVLIFAAFLLLATAATAQNSKQAVQSDSNSDVLSAAQQEPQAVVIYQSKPQPSQLIVKITDMCDGDNLLTEQVIAEIYKRKDLQITDVIDDAEFSQLSRDEQNECVCESEVNEIINQLKR